MASQSETSQQWYEEVSRGKLRTFGTGSPYWYRGKFLFHHDEPIARLENKLDGGVLLIVKHTKWVPVVTGKKIKVLSSGFTYERNEGVPRLHVWDIGVRTAYEGEETVEGPHLWKLIHWQLQASLDARAGHADRLTPAQASEWGHNHITMWHSAWNDAQQHLVLLRQAWPEAPDLRSVGAYITEVIETKAAKYNDPKAVEKRERSKARKQMKDALGLAAED